VLAVVFPLAAGTIPIDAFNSVQTDFGFFPGDTVLQIAVSGTVNLGPSATTMNPDGSLVTLTPADCFSCWIGYQYFLPDGPYPTAYGGDGINHFLGGGGNYDMFNPQGFAPQGAATTDTTDLAALRFGAVAGTFSASPTRSDWFFVGYGGSNFRVPAGGAHLYLVVVDTYYPNNTGSYLASVNAAIPEPTGIVLTLSGLLVGGLFRRRWTRA
jgi:hypothetical protein